MFLKTKYLKINDKNIGNFNLIVTIFLISFFILAITISTIVSKNNSYERLQNELYSKFIASKKQQIRTEVLTMNNLFMSNLDSLNLSEKEQKEYVIKSFNKLNKLNPKEYFFIFQLIKKDNHYMQKVLVHPSTPRGKLINKDRTDIKGKKFVKTFQNGVLTKGSTFLNYSFIHPITKKESSKVGFFILNKWNWIIGKGFFLEDTVGVLKDIERNIYNDTQQEITEYIFITLLFLGVLIFFVSKVNSFTNGSIEKFRNEAERERKKLKKSEDYLKQYTNIIESCTIVTKTDTSGVLMYVSDGFCMLMGYTKEELLGNSYKLFFDKDSIDEYHKKMTTTVLNKKTYTQEVKNITKSGEPLYSIVSVAPILDEDGRVIQFISHRFNITKEVTLQKKLKKQNEELLKSEKILNDAQKIAHIGHWELNYDTCDIKLSIEARRIFGLDKSIEVLPFSELKKFFHKDDLEKVKDIKNFELNEDNQFYIEHRIVKEDKSLVYVEVKGEYINSEDGEIHTSIGIINDVTDRKLAEKKLQEKDIILQQQSKMAAMGEMISNIAHQWRQPLSLISTVATGAKLQKELGVYDESKFEENLTMINDTAQYLSKTIDDFRNFFKTDNKKSDFKVSSVVKKAVSLVKPQFKNREINIIENIEDNEIFGLENEFIQVLINILNNARDQLAKKDSNKYIIIESKIEVDKNIISIKDNGGGIEENILNRIFEPYFTTKYNSEGTGIGLYMSEEIIVKHMDGQIKASNTTFRYNGEEYHGAMFSITLPNIKKEK